LFERLFARFKTRADGERFHTGHFDAAMRLVLLPEGVGNGGAVDQRRGGYLRHGL
jgi:hypothetical protein